jgi:hypothetical protein
MSPEIIRVLVGAIAENRIRDLLIELLINCLAPGSPRRGRRPKEAPAVDLTERKRERARKYAAKKRAAAKEAARSAVSAATGKRCGRPRKNGSNGNGTESAVTAKAFWQHAEKLEPTRPWRAVIREFDVKEAIAQNCYRKLSLPPSIGPMAITKFLTLPAPA